MGRVCWVYVERKDGGQGVVVTQQNVIGMMREGTGGEEVWVNWRSYGVGESVKEIWEGLMKGGKVVVTRGLGRESGEVGRKLYEVVEKEAVSVLYVSNSVFGSMAMEEERQGRGMKLKYVEVEEERLEEGLKKRWKERHPATVAASVYGRSGWGDYVLKQEGLGGEKGLQVRGGARVYVLDDRGEVVRRGVGGELGIGRTGTCAAGECKMLWNGEKVYVGGEKVRWATEGRLEYLSGPGREKRVKGVRVREEEVEGVMVEVKGVVEAVAEVVGEAGRNR